jgi:hypothetical protein
LRRPFAVLLGTVLRHCVRGFRAGLGRRLPRTAVQGQQCLRGVG